ncbi:hypothetical protein H4S06_004354 [Coemansia sp. BCRC 34490]|nr:hypothetical protein H4S06_004354 [Coemansia sp. BCRC 34490]
MQGLERDTRCARPVTNNAVWPIEHVLKLLRHWGPTAKLSDSKLAVKTAMLLALATMWRPTSEIGALRQKDIHVDGSLLSVQVAYSKARTYKKLRIQPLTRDNILCPVQMTQEYMDRMGYQYHSEEDNQFFRIQKGKSTAPRTVAG